MCPHSIPTVASPDGVGNAIAGRQPDLATLRLEGNASSRADRFYAGRGTAFDRSVRELGEASCRAGDTRHRAFFR